MSGLLPEGWAAARIGDLISKSGVFSDGDWVESKDQDPSGSVRLTQLADVGDGRFLDKSRRFLTPAKAAELRCTCLKRGDVLIARMPDPLGRACIFPGCGQECITVVDVCIVRPGTQGVEPRWLMHFVNSPVFRSSAHALQSGSTRKRVSRKNLSTIELPVPPSNEQNRIVAKIEELFSKLDAGVAALKRVRENLKKYRASVLKGAVEGKLTEQWRAENPDVEPASVLLDRILAERRKRWEEEQLRKYEEKGKMPPKGWKDKYKEPVQPDTEKLPALPDGWCWATVDQVGDVLLGRQRAPQFLTGKFNRPYLRVANVKDDRIDLSDLLEMDFDEQHFEKYRLREGDILVSEGQSRELVGQSAIYRGGVDGLCFQKTLHRFRPIPGGPSSAFAQIVFRAHVRGGVFSTLAPITTNIAHLTLEKFKKSRFPLSPASEGPEMTMRAQALLSLADAVERDVTTQVRRAAVLRQSILKRAFEGKLVPQNPTDEPASVLLDRIRREREAGTDARKKKTKKKRASKRIKTT